MSLACSFASSVTYRWRRKTSAATATVGAAATATERRRRGVFARGLGDDRRRGGGRRARRPRRPAPIPRGHGRDEVEVEVGVERGGVGRRRGRGRAVQGVRGGGKGRQGPARAEADEGPRVGPPARDGRHRRARCAVVALATIGRTSRAGTRSARRGAGCGRRADPRTGGPRAGARRGAERHRSPRSGALRGVADSGAPRRATGRLKIACEKISKAHRWHAARGVRDRRVFSSSASRDGTAAEEGHDTRWPRARVRARPRGPRSRRARRARCSLLPPHPRRPRVGAPPGARDVEVITFDLDDTLWPTTPVVMAANQALVDFCQERIPGFPDCAGVNARMPRASPRCPEPSVTFDPDDTLWPRLPRATNSSSSHSSASPARSPNRARHQSDAPHLAGDTERTRGTLGEARRASRPALLRGAANRRAGSARRSSWASRSPMPSASSPRVPRRVDPDPRRRRSRARSSTASSPCSNSCARSTRTRASVPSPTAWVRRGRGSRRFFDFEISAEALMMDEMVHGDDAEETRGFAVRARGQAAREMRDSAATQTRGCTSATT